MSDPLSLYPGMFVHGDVEVYKTGRTAEKPLPGGKKLLLVEITPANPEEGTWKKWVAPNTLAIITSGKPQ